MKCFGLLAVSVLNNPGILALIIAVCVLLMIGIIVLIAKLPKIKQSLKTKKEKRDQQREQEQIENKKGKELAFKALNEKEVVHDNRLSSDEITDVLDIVQHKQKDSTVVEKKEKEQNLQDKAKVDDVIGILQGQVASSKAYKKQDDFKSEETKQKEKSEQKVAEQKVDFVLGVMGSNKDNMPKQQVKKTSSAKKSNSKKEGS